MYVHTNMNVIEEIKTNKIANTEYPINELIAKRWSTRAFDPDRVIESNTLMSLFEAARWSPSAYNEQPWRFIYGVKRTESYDMIFQAVNEWNQKWVKNAPVLTLVIAKRDLQNGNINKHSWHDTGLAVANLSLQATELGIYVHQMGGIYPDKARELFRIPENFDVVSIIALGYREENDELDPGIAAGENASRNRKPVNQIAFEGIWKELN